MKKLLAPQEKAATVRQGPVPSLQRKADHDTPPAGIPPVVAEILHSPGQPLDPATRAMLEPRFGHDFSQVRIHHDEQAAASAKAVNALAYTVGSHIVFEAGAFNPHSQDGIGLLAHELTHTIQQRDGAHGSAESTAGEHEASESAGRLAFGSGISMPQHTAAPGVARQTKPGSPDVMEVVVTKEDNNSYLVFYDPAIKQDRRLLLAVGTQVEVVKKGKEWHEVTVTSGPEKGRKGMLKNKFLIPSTKVPAKEEKKAEPPKAAAAPAPAKPENIWVKRMDERLPKNKRWVPKGGPNKTSTAINALLLAKDYWVNEPKDQEISKTILLKLQENFADKYLTDDNFEKNYGYKSERAISGLAQTNFRMIFYGAKGAIPMLINWTIKLKADPQGIWDAEIGRFKAAAEMIEVLSGDAAAKDAKNLEYYVAATTITGKNTQAFFEGLVAGLKSQLSEEDVNTLSKKLLQSQVFSMVLPPVILAGATAGIADDAADLYKSIKDFVKDPGEVISTTLSLLSDLMTDEEAARVLGEAMGTQHSKKLKEMAGQDIPKFTFEVGRLVGPTIVYTVLSILGVEAIVAGKISALLAKFLKRYPKAAKALESAKSLIKLEKTAKAVEDAAKVEKGAKVVSDAAKVEKAVKATEDAAKLEAAAKDVSKAADEAGKLEKEAKKVVSIDEGRRIRERKAAQARAKVNAQKKKLAAGAEKDTPVAAFTDEEIAESIAEDIRPTGHGDPLNKGDVPDDNVRKTRTVKTGEYDPWLGDSSLLAKRLEDAKMPKPGPGYQAHHMVPSNEPAAARLREFLQKRGFKDINHPDNGVWLPTGSQTPNLGAEFKHEFTFDRGRFGREYFERMEEILMRDPKISDAGIRLKLRGIRMYLQQGKLPPPLL